MSWKSGTDQRWSDLFDDPAKARRRIALRAVVARVRDLEHGLAETRDLLAEVEREEAERARKAKRKR